MASCAALVAVAAVAGCGSVRAGAHKSTVGQPPRDAARSASAALLDGHDLQATIRLDTTPAALEHAVPPGSKAMPAGLAAALAGGVVTLSLHAKGADSVGTELAKALPLFGYSGGFVPLPPLVRNAEEGVVVRAGGGEAEFRLVGGSAYARADVRRFAALSGSTVRVESWASGEHVPSAFRGVARAAVDGAWVRVDAGTVDAVNAMTAKQLGAGASGMPDFSKALTNLARAVARDANVTRVGSDGADDHLRATLTLKTLATDGMHALDEAVQAAGPGPGTSVDGPAGVPDTPVGVDLTTHDGVLSRLRVDLVPLLSGIQHRAVTGPLAVVIDLAQEAAPVSAPDSSTPLDIVAIARTALRKLTSDAALLPSGVPCPSPGPNVYGCVSLPGSAGMPARIDGSGMPTDLPCPSGMPADAQKDLCRNGKFIVPTTVPRLAATTRP